MRLDRIFESAFARLEENLRKEVRAERAKALAAGLPKPKGKIKGSGKLFTRGGKA